MEVCTPGPIEAVIWLFFACIFSIIPLAFAVFLLISHIKIHASLKSLHEKLNATANMK
jgi:hypothetical protein